MCWGRAQSWWRPSRVWEASLECQWHKEVTQKLLRYAVSPKGVLLRFHFFDMFKVSKMNYLFLTAKINYYFFWLVQWQQNELLEKFLLHKYKNIFHSIKKISGIVQICQIYNKIKYIMKLSKSKKRSIYCMTDLRKKKKVRISFKMG